MHHFSDTPSRHTVAEAAGLVLVPIIVIRRLRVCLEYHRCTVGGSLSVSKPGTISHLVKLVTEMIFYKHCVAVVSSVLQTHGRYIYYPTLILIKPTSD